jgi:DNA-binding NtrC family response regulator
MPRQKILVVEDEDLLRLGVGEYLRRQGYEVSEAATCQAARDVFQSSRPDVAVVDYLLPDGNALELLPRLREIDASVPVIILTGHGTIDLAVRAVKEGAEQFLSKPLDFPVLHAAVRQVLDNHRTRRKLLASKTQRVRDTIDPFLGASAAIRELADQARRVVNADSPILIQGETGTGKGVLATWIHENGPRAEEALVDFNCAGLARDLVETEFFGHERGAFTGAVGSKMGLLEVAHRGTVFLDEIGDMDLQIQPKLLKVLEERRFRRVGDVRDRQVDVRLIAATHRNLEALVREKQFRADLYFRISTIPLVVPPLRERAEDIVPIARHLAGRLVCDLSAGEVSFSSDTERALTRYPWPGNIRELRNVLERAILLRRDDVLTSADLRFGAEATAQNAGDGGDGSAPATMSLAENERRHIERVLRATAGSVTEAARTLGISRSSLYEKLRKHGITAQR